MDIVSEYKFCPKCGSELHSELSTSGKTLYSICKNSKCRTFIKGNIVDVEIVPAKVDASIEIKSPSKTIPVKVVPEGDLAFGKSIQTIETSISTITVYGDEDILDSLEYVPIKIDVSGLSEDKEYSLNIEKPSGVRDMSSKTINVKLKIGDVEAKEITGIGITPINLDSKYKVQATSETDREVTVIVKGSPDVLEKVTKDNITATVDLKGLGPGEHEIDVKVTGEDVKATYESKTKKVKVNFFKNDFCSGNIFI